MPQSDGVPSSPPGPATSSVDAIAYYKAQYESLEAELTEFQASSKELEAELEKDIEASEKRERQLKEKAGNLSYEVDEWKAKYKQSKAEANSAQNTLQKEVTTLRDTNRTLQMRLRDTEVANDDYERQQRNTESSLEDLESKYSMAIERSVMMEEEIKIGEQEREALRIETQRLRDELSDLRIEADITKEKLSKTTGGMNPGNKLLRLQSATRSTSPRSELSPTTSDSTPSFDTPPGKTISSSEISDIHTPPSPPTSEKSVNAPRPFKTPILPKTRMSLTSNNTTPRPATHTLKPPKYSRAPSIPGPSDRSTPSAHLRQSLSRPDAASQRGGGGLAQSNSIYHLHNLQGKMQRLTERVHTAKSRLPAPVNTPPKSSPRSNATRVVSSNIPATVTMRSSRKRANGSSRINGAESPPDGGEVGENEAGGSTPSSLRPRSSRASLRMGPPAATPTRINPSPDRSAPHSFSRPSSRASATSNPIPGFSSTRDSYQTYQTYNQHQQYSHVYQPGHAASQPGSRASISSSTNGKDNNNNTTSIKTHARPLLSHRRSQQKFTTPNASTDRVRPKSSLSNYNFDGAMDVEDEEVDAPSLLSLSAAADDNIATPTSAATASWRRSLVGQRNSRASRVSDVGGGAATTTPFPTPNTTTHRTKRISTSRLPAPSGRQSLGFGGGNNGSPSRPVSRQSRESESGTYDLSRRPTSSSGGSIRGTGAAASGTRPVTSITAMNWNSAGSVTVAGGGGGVGEGVKGGGGERPPIEDDDETF